jgi:hypothetical protein
MRRGIGAVNDPQSIWNGYYDRMKRRRLAEAERLWEEVEAAGMMENTAFFLDFVHFCNVLSDANDLARQLSENYVTNVVTGADLGYYYIKGTTRPEGVCLTKAQHLAWVEFMHDVAASYACVFSAWTLEAPAFDRSFQSHHLRAD